MNNTNTKNSSYLLPVYKRAPYKFIKGKGSFLFDKNGQKYLDFATGIAVNAFGYGNSKILKALNKQSKKVWHLSNLYEIEGLEELAKSLCDIANLRYAFFTNSGAESLECGIKMVRKYHYEQGTKKHRIIVFEDAFHGRTNATIAASNQEKMIKGFGPLFEGFDIVKRSIDAVKDAITAQTGAILLESIQGEGGINVFDNEFLNQIRKICDDYNILMFVDEVQCGIGRTGKFFAYQWASDVTPDIVAIAKGIGNGFPIGACLCNKKVGESMTVGSHGSTYGNNPLGIAVASTVINLVNKPKFYNEITEKGNYFIQKLTELKNSNLGNIILEIKGKGLMIGIKLSVDNIEFANTLRANKLLTVPAQNNVIRILPPLNVSKKEIDMGIKIIAKTLQKL